MTYRLTNTDLPHIADILWLNNTWFQGNALVTSTHVDTRLRGAFMDCGLDFRRPITTDDIRRVAAMMLNGEAWTDYHSRKPVNLATELIAAIEQHCEIEDRANGEYVAADARIGEME